MSKKYPRTYHFPFSEGATNDDKIAQSFENLIGKDIIITEKMDGENSCLNKYGVFSRSHSATTQNPWASYLWERWNLIHKELGELEIFGESLYAVHAIEYTGLKEYFYVFAIREGEKWLSWEQVELYADLLQIPIAPLLFKGKIEDEQVLKKMILELVKASSSLSDLEIGRSVREGLVVRIAREFDDSQFAKSVFKWVRKNHVQTDEHWRKNWKRARLNFEIKAIQEKQLKNLKILRENSFSKK